MKLVLAFLITIVSHNLFAQHETDERVIGFKYILKFSNGEPKITIHNTDFYNPHNINYKGPNVIPYVNSICDTTGNLLFYYDGATLYASDGSPMSGGNLHQYNFSTHYTSTLIVPIEESNRRYYYLFEVLPAEDKWDYISGKPLNCPPQEICPEFRDICTLTYHIIDMHENGGKGKVIQNTIFVTDSVAPSISGSKHRNNIDTWVTVLKSRSENILNFRVNSCNIQSPVISVIPDYEYPENPYTSYITNYGLGYQLVYSSKGDMAVLPGTIKSANTNTSINYALFVVPFDNETGLFETTLLKTIPVISGLNLNLFSHDSKYLYYFDTFWLGSSTWMYQYEVSTGTSVPFYYNVDKNRFTGTDYGQQDDLLIYKFKFTPIANNVSRYEGYLGKVKNIHQAFVSSNLIDSLQQPAYEQPLPIPTYSYILRNNYIYNFYHPDYKKPAAFPVAKSISNTVSSPSCFNEVATLKGNTNIPVDSLYWLVKKSTDNTWQRFDADTVDITLGPGTYTASLVAYKFCLADSSMQQFTLEDYPAVHLTDDTLYTCESKALQFPVNDTYTYNWYNAAGDKISGYAQQTGQYTMIVENSCGTQKDSLYLKNSTLDITNLVTPNNDNQNDCMRATSNNLNETINISIYNSWGSRIFYDMHYTNNWCPENSLSDGLYYYEARYNNNCSKKGWVEIVR